MDQNLKRSIILEHYQNLVNKGLIEDGTYILFATGNAFSFKNNSISYNDLEIAKNVNDVKFEYYKDEENNEVKDIVTVNVQFNNYSKQINYKIEEG